MSIIKSILKTELIRNTSVLITGTVLAQLIAILLQPVLRRIYPVEAFGVYSVYISLIGMVAVISTLRYDDAIVLPEKDSEAANLLALSQILNLVIVLLVLVLIFFLGERFLKFINFSSKLPVSVFFLVPIGAWLLNFSQGFSYWLIRKKKYGDVTISKVARRSSEGGSQVLMAILNKPAGLILSDVVGQFVNIFFLIFRGFKNGLRLQMISRKKIGYTLAKYSEFPKFNLIPAFLSTYSFALPALLINKYYSVEDAGFFDASRTVLSIPMAFVAVSVSNVLLQKTSELYNLKKSLVSEIKPVLIIILAMMLVETVLITLFGPLLFRLFFSSKYIFSGEISRILVWSFALNFLISSFSCLFYSLRKIRIYSIWQTVYFIGILSLIFFSKLEFTHFLKVYVCIEVICYLALVVTICRMVADYEKGIRKAIVKYV